MRTDTLTSENAGTYTFGFKTYSVTYSELICGKRMFDHVTVKAVDEDQGYQKAKEILTDKEGLVIGCIYEETI